MICQPWPNIRRPNNKLARSAGAKTEKYHLVLIFPALNLRDIFELLSYHLLGSLDFNL
jgi:hypothetical protein